LPELYWSSFLGQIPVQADCFTLSC